MDLLLNKLERLTPEQRKEVEDYVDFLIFRSDSRPDPVRPVAPVPPVLMATPQPLDLTPVTPVPPAQPSLSFPFPDASASVPVPPEPAPELVHEIAGSDDYITRDYMDLGQYEQPPSPATDAVKKVKRKLIQREEQDASHHVLEWID
jgi:hypothetical protein